MLSDSHPDQPPVYLERLALIRKACEEEALRNLSHTEVSKFVLDRIFVCDKHKILFCQTPKVGNTQWKKVLIVLNGTCGTWGCPLQWERGARVASNDGVVSLEKTHDLPEGSMCCFPHYCYTVKIGGVNLLVLFVQCQP